MSIVPYDKLEDGGVKDLDELEDAVDVPYDELEDADVKDLDEEGSD